MEALTGQNLVPLNLGEGQSECWGKKENYRSDTG